MEQDARGSTHESALFRMNLCCCDLSMTQKLTRKEIEKIRKERLLQMRERYKGADCGTPALWEEFQIDEDYRKMLWENGVETELERTMGTNRYGSSSKTGMATRKALIVGATGLVDGFCLQALLDDANYSEVIALVRKPLLKHIGSSKRS